MHLTFQQNNTVCVRSLQYTFYIQPVSHHLFTSILYLQSTGRMYAGTGKIPPSGLSNAGSLCSPDFETYKIMSKTGQHITFYDIKRQIKDHYIQYVYEP